MVAYMMGPGKIIRRMVMEFIHRLMELDMKENGKKIYNMDKGKRYLLTEVFMKVNISVD